MDDLELWVETHLASLINVIQHVENYPSIVMTSTKWVTDLFLLSIDRRIRLTRS